MSGVKELIEDLVARRDAIEIALVGLRALDAVYAVPAADKLTAAPEKKKPKYARKVKSPAKKIPAAPKAKLQKKTETPPVCASCGHIGKGRHKTDCQRGTHEIARGKCQSCDHRDIAHTRDGCQMPNCPCREFQKAAA